jgi:hypothetical protein
VNIKRNATTPKINVQYTPIKRENIETVSLCDSTDLDYQKYIEYFKIHATNQRSQLHMDLYKEHKQAFDEFGIVLKEFFSGEISHVDIECFGQSTCKNCFKSSLDYKDKTNFWYVCFLDWQNKGVYKRVSPTEKCVYIQPRNTLATKITLSGCSNNIIREKIFPPGSYGASNIKNYFNNNKLDLEEKSLRCAWYFCEFWKHTTNSYGCSMSFSLPVLTNIAIDIIGLPFHRKGIAHKARLFEKQVITAISHHLEINPYILKIKYRNDSIYHFKRIDCFCYDKINSLYYVLEIFTCRSEEEKVIQVQDYCYLLNLVGYKNIKPLLITEDLSYNSTEGANNFGVQRYTLKGFMIKILSNEVA